MSKTIKKKPYQHLKKLKSRSLAPSTRFFVPKTILLSSRKKLKSELKRLINYLGYEI